MYSEAIQLAADRLRHVDSSRAPVRPVRDLLGPDDLTAAYAVQEANLAVRLGAGRRIVGRKIGLTNPSVQRQLGVDQPDFGVLLDDMACPDRATITMDRLLQPKIEAEVAFVLGADLDRDGPITVTAVRDAVAYASPALEIVDSRIAGWDITIVDTIADNASSGLYVLGPTRVAPHGFVPAEVTMTLDCDGTPVSSGRGADCLGDPLLAVAWLATVARDHGRPLRAHEVVLSGALGPMVTVEAGSTYTARISALGSVTARFGARDRSASAEQRESDDFTKTRTSPCQ